MASSNNSISIVISAQDQASATLSKVRGEIQQTGDTADEASPKADRFGSTLGTLGSRIRFVAETFAIYGIAKSVTDFAGSAVTAAAQLEQTNIAFQSLIGNTQEANKVFAQLVQYANVTPFQSKDIVQAAQTLMGFGTAGQQTVDILKQLGDVVSVGGGNLQQLSLVTGQIFAQGKLRAQDMYQVINDGGAGLIKIMAADAGGMQKLTDEFNAGGIPAQDYFDAITKATANGGFAFQGANREAETFSGRLSTLKDAATQFGMALIGVKIDPQLGYQVQSGGVFDRMRDGIGSVTVELQKLEPQMQQVMPDLLANFTKIAGEVGQELGPSFRALFNTISSQVIPVLGKLWHEVIEPLLPVLGATFVLAIRLVADTLNLLLRVLTPVINFLLDHRQAVIDFAAAFTALGIAMKFEAIQAAFSANIATMAATITTVRASVTGLWATIAAGSVMGNIAIAGALADIALVAAAVQSVIGAIQAMNNTAQAATADAAGQQAAEQSIINSFKAGKISKAEEQKLLTGIAQPVHALGTNFAATDSFIAGEGGGPELVVGAKGAKVYNARDTQKMLGSAGKTVHIQTLNVNNNVDIGRVIRTIGWKLAAA